MGKIDISKYKESRKKASNKWRDKNPDKVKENNARWNKIIRQRAIDKRKDEMIKTGLPYYPVFGYEDNYIINKLGEVRKTSNYIIVKSSKNKDGYLIITLNDKVHLLHRVIAFTFIPNDDPVNKKHITHINQIKDDNRLENLKWVSRSENMKDLIGTGKLKSNLTGWTKKKKQQSVENV